ncbi:RNA polymerase sigma factor SigI [Bacillus sp. PS06]|uniref:RNA polymerase sigma factor SigI n=1 Tax=Bacillus sp. PS06 TaxID=2764176 RepID=UPI001785EB6D|nr:RNA polymerase sigma factor SigI [Bacillus sp. PS06]MBD8067449.1 RNA polymerase sigma factor SigI [Bacillus sp. PS06]
MLSLLFKLGRSKSSLEDSVIRIQNGDKALQNELIEKYKPFVAKSVSSVCKRFISEQDDEFSIGLIAFNEAIEKYSTDKGSSLLSFADLLIKRRVIDFIRKEARVKTIRMDSTDIEDDSYFTKIESKQSIDQFQQSIEQEQRKDEIVRFQKKLTEFGLSFNEIVDQSPKHADARLNAMTIAKIIVEDDSLRSSLFEKKQLPVKKLEKVVDVSRKTIERNRKYIIAMTLILSQDYLYLKDYIKGVLGE